MKALRTTLVLTCAGLMLGSTLSFAQKKDENAPPGTDTGPNCDITGYKTERIVYPTPIAIPDDDPVGLTLGPIFMPPDGDLVNDVVLELNASHTWIGDLIVELVYDPDCEGPAGGIAARAICRPRGTAVGSPPPCGGAAGTFGCSGNLDGTAPYRISDDATTPIASGLCTAIIAPGCYKQSDLGTSPFSIWRGLPKGGCWYLHVSDNAGADLGAVFGWAVFIRNQHPVPTVAQSWGRVKNIYR